MRAALKGGYAMLWHGEYHPLCSTPEWYNKTMKRPSRWPMPPHAAAAAGENLDDKIPTDYASLSKVTGMLTNDGKTIFSDDFMKNLLLASKQYGFD